MKQGALYGLYAITPDELDDVRLLAASAAVLAGGARLLQYRNKSAAADVQLRQTRALRQLCRAADALLIVNDDIELALAVDADGVHLGGDDGDLRAARRRLGQRILGASCYGDLERAQAAADAGADYLAFGAIYASASKPAAAAIGLERLASARQRFSLPLCAIGGINDRNAAAVRQAGADMLAVIGGLFQAANPQLAASQLAALYPGSGPA